MHLWVIISPLISLVIVLLIAYVLLCPQCLYLSLASACAAHIGTTVGLYQWSQIQAALSGAIYVSIFVTLFWSWAIVAVLVAILGWMSAVIWVKRHWVKIVSCVVFGLAAIVYTILIAVSSIPDQARRSGILATQISVGLSLLIFCVATLIDIRQIEVYLRASSS
jgi:hypothetical protein